MCLSDTHAAKLMMLAASNGNLVGVRRLLKCGVSASSRAGIGLYTPLKHAAVNNHVAIMALLLLAGADIDSCGDGGRTALYFAAIVFQPEAVKFLLENGAKTSVTSREGSTPIMAAMTMFLPCNVMDERKLSIISYLLEAGAVVYGHTVYRFSTLVEVVRAPYFSIPPPFQDRLFDLVIKYKADINEVDAEGNSALHYAAKVENFSMTMRLLNNGANMYIRNSQNRTAKETCKRNHDVRVADLFEEVDRRIQDIPRIHAFSMGLHRRAFDSPVQVLSKEYVNKIFNVKRSTTEYEHSIDYIVDLQLIVLNQEM
jgi:ankyrin repeat protein